MRLSPRSETIAFRAWAAAQKVGWNFTLSECAIEIEVPVNSLKMIAQKKRLAWTVPRSG